MVTQREVVRHHNKLTKQQRVAENQVCCGLRTGHLCHHHLESSSGQPKLWSLSEVKATFIFYHVAEVGVGAESCVPAYGVCSVCCDVQHVWVGSTHGTLSLSWD